MLLKNYSKSTVLFFQISILVLVVVLYRSILIPFTHDEVASFIYFIQSGNFLPFYAHIDANNHVLNSGLAHLFFKVFGDSPFVLRLPNLFGFILLIIGTFRISKSLKNILAKGLLLSFLLCSFPFISFFSVCRGYGLSMGLLIIGLSYFIAHLRNPEKNSFLLLFSLFMQLALSSNLTLIILIALLFSHIVILQIINKKLFYAKNILINLINFTLVAFWIYYLLFLKENYALYLGKGDNIWEITFKSLFTIFSGSSNKVVHILLLFFTFFISFLSIISMLKSKSFTTKKWFTDPLTVFLSILVVIFFMFFIQKHILNINFPEGRAALFLYPLFVLIFVFYTDDYPLLINKVLSVFFITGLVFQFLLTINFSKHSIEEYVTIPNRFYDYLLKEQSMSKTKITIGGHPYRELIYNFINYRNDGKLNLENISENKKIDIYSDYFIGHVKDSDIYYTLYNMVDSEPDWGFTLLKRKSFVKRELAWANNEIIEINNEEEFNNLFCFNDTILNDTSPMLVEIDFKFIKSPIPNNSRFILEISDKENKNNIYKRVPLNWLKFDWNNLKDCQYNIVTEETPKYCNRIICYLWNIDKKEIHLIINKMKIYRLYN